MHIKDNVRRETKYAILLPKTAVHALPPSNRPIGSKFTADTTSPDKPTKNKGWTGIGCDRGSIIILGAIKDAKAPTKKLDLITAAGTVAKLDINSAGVFMVRAIPPIKHKRDAMREAIGPLKAKSNKADRDGGNERIGVMLPKVPI